MKYKIGVYGSSAGDMAAVVPKAVALGRVLGKYAEAVIIITGGCAGLPYLVAKEAHAGGVEIWGYSAERTLKELQQVAPEDDHTVYSKLEFVPDSYPLIVQRQARMKYRNVISTAQCDAGIILSGRWGTLNEFTNLIDQKKLVGVLGGTGGIADELPSLTSKIHKEGQGEVIFEDDPVTLVEKILENLRG